MKTLSEIKQNPKVMVQEVGEDGGWALASLAGSKTVATIIFSWGGGWDHVSASFKHRCCTWDEMCELKDMFFREDECVIQYHPPKKDYISMHPYVLHLWRPQNQEIPMPPKYMV